MAFEAPAPLNYMLNLPDPSESIRDSLKSSLLIQQGQREQQAAQDVHAAAQQDAQIKGVAIQQQQLEQAQRLAFQKRFQENAKNPTAAGNLSLIQEFPQFAAQITGASKALSAEEAKQLAPIHAAGLAGARDVQAQKIKDLAASYINSKDPQQQAHGQSLLDGLKLQQSNPGAYDTMMGVKIADGIGGEEYAKMYGGVAKLPAEIAAGKSDAAIKALDALHEEEKLKDAHRTAAAAADASDATTKEKDFALKTAKDLAEFNRRKTIAETEKAEADALKTKRDAQGLPEEGKKQYGEVYKDFVSANQAVNKSSILANRIRTVKPYSGYEAVVNKYWHQFLGTPDETAQINQQLSGITSSSVIGDMAALGRITPAEIELLQHSIPAEDAAASDKADWLDAYGKVMAFKRDQALEKANYINANGDLTPAKRNITINGKKYPIGSPPPGLELPSPSAQAPAADPAARLAQIRARKAELMALAGKK